MNRPNRQIVRILILTTLLAITGVQGYYCGRACFAKWAFAHQTHFSDNELIRIVVHQKSLTAQTDFLVNKEEFLWGGEMVDVLYREVRSDTLYIYGFRDKIETGLSQEAAWLFQDTTQSDELPAASTKKVGWDTLVCSSSKYIFSAFHVGEVPVSLVNFVYRIPHLRLPFLEVPCMPPIQ